MISQSLWSLIIVIAVLGIFLGWLAERGPQVSSPIVETPHSASPPWRYGQPDARFTLIEYADLECPYCQAYFPVLKRWIDTTPDVNWQWHHLPLSMHEPAATQEARLAECAGLTGGQAVFWTTVSWIYQHTRGDGRGLPSGTQLPHITPDLQECLASERPDATIQTHIQEAAQAGISATPTLRVVDNATGKSLLLAGTVEHDGLLSALDLLASSTDESGVSETLTETLEMPADSVSDMPR